MTPIVDASSPEWMRVDYARIRPPRKSGGIGPVPAPAVPIRVRNPAAAPLPDSLNIVRGRGLIDTGANMSSVPLWAVQELGIEAGEGDKQPTFGVGGGFDSYRIKVGIHVQIGGHWLDIGVVRALSPDTESSRRRSAHLPFLLGRDGFLDKFNACFDERDGAVWLRKDGGGAWPRRSQDPRQEERPVDSPA